jgi:hypothetical protein
LSLQEASAAMTPSLSISSEECSTSSSTISSPRCQGITIQAWDH